MGAGLSWQQKLLLKKIRHQGYLEIYDVMDTLAVERNRREGRDKDAFQGLLHRAFHQRGEAVKDIRNISGLYRMMKGLERYGFVASILGLTQRLWLSVEWEGDTPKIDFMKHATTEAMIKFGREERMRFSTRGSRWEFYKLTSQPD